ncbi:hypothetical protein J6590_038487 [Homalodisca vitripennis]|nr:hypothetical protein J6590_038487 [Homalodisca vitripennis]
MSVVSRTHIVHIVICSLVIGTTRNCSAQRRCQLSVGLTHRPHRDLFTGDWHNPQLSCAAQMSVVSRTQVALLVICSLLFLLVLRRPKRSWAIRVAKRQNGDSNNWARQVQVLGTVIDCTGTASSGDWDSG